jgi:hypothetical protein
MAGMQLCNMRGILSTTCAVAEFELPDAVEVASHYGRCAARLRLT